MAKPAKPTIPSPPLRTAPSTFSALAEAFLNFFPTFATYLDDVGTYTGQQADSALAAALGGTLPSPTGHNGKPIRVKADATGVEFAAVYSTTATAAGTTTLTAASSEQQYFTGALAQTITLPVASTLFLGQQFTIINNSTGVLSVQSSGANAVITVQPQMVATCTCILISGTTAASWNADVIGFGAISGTGAAVMQTSPTITTPNLTAPVMTGVPTAPTAAVATNTTQVATTAFAKAVVAADIGVANCAPVKTAINAAGSAPIYACRAWVNFNGTVQSGTYARTTTTVTVTLTAHGLVTGETVALDFTTGTAADGDYVVTVVDANTFTVVTVASGATSGAVTRNPYIRSAGNVSSITRNSVGNYTVTFATAMPDANYAWFGAANTGSSATDTRATVQQLSTQTSTAAALQISTMTGTNSTASTDLPAVTVMVMR